MVLTGDGELGFDSGDSNMHVSARTHFPFIYLDFGFLFQSICMPAEENIHFWFNCRLDTDEIGDPDSTSIRPFCLFSRTATFLPFAESSF